MAKYVLAYRGPQGMGDTPEQQQALAQAWLGWYGSLGGAIVDPGNPFGQAATVRHSGTDAGGASGLTGYVIIDTADLDAAAQHASGCPVLAAGGHVEVYEALPVP